MEPVVESEAVAYRNERVADYISTALRFTALRPMTGRQYQSQARFL